MDRKHGGEARHTIPHGRRLGVDFAGHRVVAGQRPRAGKADVHRFLQRLRAHPVRRLRPVPGMAQEQPAVPPVLPNAGEQVVVDAALVRPDPDITPRLEGAKERRPCEGDLPAAGSQRPHPVIRLGVHQPGRFVQEEHRAADRRERSEPFDGGRAQRVVPGHQYHLVAHLADREPDSTGCIRPSRGVP